MNPATLKPIAKAIAGGLVAGLAVLAASLDGGITAAEWLQAASAAVAGTGLVYVVPNAPVHPRA